MTEMIKQEAENNIQVFEILETNSSDKLSKNNKIAALLNKSNNKVKRTELYLQLYCIIIKARDHIIYHNLSISSSNL